MTSIFSLFSLLPCAVANDHDALLGGYDELYESVLVPLKSIVLSAPPSARLYLSNEPGIHAISEERSGRDQGSPFPDASLFQVPLSPSTILHANPMPGPNTTSVKPAGIHREVGDIIQLYDRSNASSVIPLPRTTSPETIRSQPRTAFGTFYYNPVTQVCLLGLVCFMCPGSFNALNGLGAAGRVDSTVNSNSNSALYATFAVAAFFAG